MASKTENPLTSPQYHVLPRDAVHIDGALYRPQQVAREGHYLRSWAGGIVEFLTHDAFHEHVLSGRITITPDYFSMGSHQCLMPMGQAAPLNLPRDQVMPGDGVFIERTHFRVEEVNDRGFQLSRGKGGRAKFLPHDHFNKLVAEGRVAIQRHDSNRQQPPSN